MYGTESIILSNKWRKRINSDDHNTMGNKPTTSFDIDINDETGGGDSENNEEE